MFAAVVLLTIATMVFNYQFSASGSPGHTAFKIDAEFIFLLAGIFNAALIVASEILYHLDRK